LRALINREETGLDALLGCRHIDSYQRTGADASWRAVWSQAMEIQSG